jgi:hypothetical protein
MKQRRAVRRLHANIRGSRPGRESMAMSLKVKVYSDYV